MKPAVLSCVSDRGGQHWAEKSVKFLQKWTEEFSCLELTSPVTKCLPSGEKDKAVMVFLLIREEQVACDVEIHLVTKIRIWKILDQRSEWMILDDPLRDIHSRQPFCQAPKQMECVKLTSQKKRNLYNWCYGDPGNQWVFPISVEFWLTLMTGFVCEDSHLSRYQGHPQFAQAEFWQLNLFLRSWRCFTSPKRLL